jgi:Cytosol aminopeptidase family, catalytic domain
MVILTYTAPTSTAADTAAATSSASGTAAVGPIVWVGKGIVYDTGGLSIKTKVHNLCYTNYITMCSSTVTQATVLPTECVL